MAHTEDIPYEVSEFATPDPENNLMILTRNTKGVLKEVQQYLTEAIAKRNCLFDVIDLTRAS